MRPSIHFWVSHLACPHTEVISTCWADNDFPRSKPRNGFSSHGGQTGDLGTKLTSFFRGNFSFSNPEVSARRRAMRQVINIPKTQFQSVRCGEAHTMICSVYWAHMGNPGERTKEKWGGFPWCFTPSSPISTLTHQTIDFEMIENIQWNLMHKAFIFLMHQTLVVDSHWFLK